MDYRYFNHHIRFDIPNSVTEIEENKFSGCWVDFIEIPNSVTKIGEGAFSGCARVKSIAIPSSVVEIGEGAFSGTDAESIVVAKSNPLFVSINNCCISSIPQTFKSLRPDA